MQNFKLGSFQFVLAGLLFYALVGSTDDLKGLFMILLLVNALAIAISAFIVSSSRSSGIFQSISFSVLAAVVFFAVGMYLEDQLSYEIVEEVGTEESDPRATVITARLVVYGGFEFLLIYLVHAIFAYAPYLEIRLSGISSEKAEFSNELFSVKTGKKLYLLPFKEIEYIEASGNYIHIFKNERKYLARLTLQEFLERSNSDELLRIHRSFIVNVKFISELETVGEGYAAILKSGKKIKISKQYKPEVFKKLGIS